MNNKITFCIVDDIDTYATVEIRTTIKNICNFTISNLYSKGYNALIGKNENNLLLQATTDYAVVMSPGTEYINGFAFFEALTDLIQHDFFIAGHILDRTKHDAYYELHHQCYVINLKHYRNLNHPDIGLAEFNVKHTQIEPLRSSDNYHDDYTPKSVSKGTKYKTYNHKRHGWNILRSAFKNNLKVLVFEDSIRNNKKHYYPESESDYYKNLDYIDYKFNYCKNEFVHYNNTEGSSGINGIYQQVVIPASGTLYLDLIDHGKVVIYDYNNRSLEYWKEHCPRKNNIEYTFVYTDLLTESKLVDYLDPDLKTFINLSNIFCYEGTAAKFSLQQRLKAQNSLVHAIENKIKNVTINFMCKADDGHRSLI